VAHLVVHAERHSQAVVVIDHLGDTTLGETVEIVVDDGAQLTLVTVQDFADADQHQEHRLFVDHAVPRCRSRVTYKGALQGEGAHTVWVGDDLIQAEAEGTDTYELNRNLVLSDG